MEALRAQPVPVRPTPPNDPPRTVSAGEELATQVRTVLASVYPQRRTERRGDRRYPFPYLMRLRPVAGDGLTPCGETVVVVGKHLSERGLGFYHPQPLPHRRMIVSLEAGCGRWIALLMDLKWCRFTRQGWYESGGRFLQVAQD